ncbi:MAG: hypothetical protein OEV42_21130 [Deltaproteobacteria bacterium]|nr:hypothetical protein [Deltaproteobacteria bacterium]
MYRRITLFIILLIFLSSEVEAGLGYVGTLDSKKENFYYTGIDIYVWSFRKAKQYKNKFKMIFRYSFEDKEEKMLYSGDCSLSGLQLSPDDNYIAGFCPTENSVLIFNMDWNKVAEIRGAVYEFAWHPDSKKVVFVTGEKSIRKGAYDMALKPDGVWLYDIAEEKKIKLSVLGKHLRLSKKERTLHLWNGEKWIIYNYDSGEVIETPKTLEDVDYSLDGRYYMMTSGTEFEPPYWSPFRIYEVKTTAALPSEEISFISERNPQKFIWGNDGKVFFDGMTSRTDAKNRLYIYDFKARKLIRQFDGAIAGNSEDLSWLVVYRDGKFYLEKF